MMTPKNPDRLKTIDLPRRGVYAILCRENGMVYVGATKTSFKRRWDTHRSALTHGKHNHRDLQRDWNLYGSDQFDFFILEEIGPFDSTAPLEKKWTKHFQLSGSCYNTAPVTESPGEPPEIVLMWLDSYVRFLIARVVKKEKRDYHAVINQALKHALTPWRQTTRRPRFRLSPTLPFYPLFDRDRRTEEPPDA